MQVIEFSEQNKLSLWKKFKTHFKSNNTYRISVVMLTYCLLVNIILLSLISVVENKQWVMIISSFNLSFAAGLVGFLILSLASKWLFDKVAFKQALAYVAFFLRLLFYGAIVSLAIIFNFFNLFGIIGGFSLLMLATVTSELLFFRKRKKEVTC